MGFFGFGENDEILFFIILFLLLFFNGYNRYGYGCADSADKK